ncbi:3-oxoacyl-[acyl-carrier-protein] synthase III C-terminal domain-containing protein [Cumulibacter soli]|uniref:3-oxoacyl-[acyl-carrier-protein] synthase III C-terminal domain-containing protein n=1 Tax=Cumulibacter soli TaxID=2546344 RepID=UPI00141A5802|nr:3-oxoacyl-[acyl-carrier-protein] synthase III C-terminal domain-containing protein [Cumulibacter soli]
MSADARYKQRLHTVSIAGVPGVALARRAARLAWARHGGRRSDRRVGHVFASFSPTGPPVWSPAAWIAGEITGHERVAFVEHLSAMCAGGAAAVGAAARWLASEPELDSVLVAAGDAVDDAVVDRWAFDSGVTLGDGAGAVVLSRQGPGHRIVCVRSGADVSLEAAQRGAPEIDFAAARPALPARIQDRLHEAIHRSAGDLSVATIIESHTRLLTDTIDAALAEANLDRADADFWALPFVGANAMQHGYLAPLGIDADRTSCALGLTTGHLGGADQLIALDWLEAGGRMQPGKIVALIGLGAGLSVSCAVMRW